MKKIKDDVEYYVDCNGDADFEENEFIYDDLDLDELSASLGGVLATSPPEHDGLAEHFANASNASSSNNSTSPSPSPSLANHSKDKSEDDRKRHKSLSEEVGSNMQDAEY